jgi:hypothetical protein
MAEQVIATAVLRDDGTLIFRDAENEDITDTLPCELMEHLAYAFRVWVAELFERRCL